MPQNYPSVQLNYKSFGNSHHFPLIILHGLFGMLDNWQTLAIRFAETHRVFTIDQRNHGKSFHSPDFNYPLLADDLFDFMHHHHLPKAHIIGHSMGGKTAMQFAVSHPQMVAKLVVVDIAPKDYPAGHDAIFDAFTQLPIYQITSRNEADELMKPLVPEWGTRQFLLKNLTRHKDGTYGWKCNVPALQQHYNQILANSLTPFDTGVCPALFLKGEKSPKYIELPEDESTIRHFFPNSVIETIANAGHWIHAEQPEAFYNAVSRFLSLP
ncbi:MAG TPA: alpha/beta fold hydrolase [Chitinophagales bacterium]|nr:alpha/beta fold hydrolase [Chitinophagales bacterium]